MLFLQTIKSFKLMAISALLMLSVTLLGGCATTTALLETATDTYAPSVMASLDSFESAAYAITLSNRVLLEIPISENDEWPKKMFGQIEDAALLKMGASLLGASQGITIPTEIDPETGFPRPTSALYTFLKERNGMLSSLNNQKVISYFSGKPESVITFPEHPNSKSTDPIVYRNLLMAYGTVTNNNKDIQSLQNDIEMTAKGYKSCNLFIHQQKQEIKDEAIKKAACPDRSITDDSAKKKLASKVADKKEEKDQMEKAYGKLANKVHSASVAGGDFTTAAITKVASAIVNGIRALPNIQQEFSGVRGAYNVTMMIPRIKNAFNALGMYKDNLGFQFAVYKTMYQQIKGTYEIKDDEKTKKALNRIGAAQTVLAGIETRLNRAAAGEDVTFTQKEAEQLVELAAMFPSDAAMKETLMAALTH
jgi:hypothetical protein